MNTVKRVWHWISPAVTGSLILSVMSEVGHGSFEAWLLAPAAVFGTLIGYTVRGVKRLRPWLGTATTWVAAATVWGVISFVTVTLPSKCPVELHDGRCSVREASIWGVNAALVVVLMMLSIEPPKVFVRGWRVWRNRKAARNTGSPKSYKGIQKKASKETTKRKST